MITILLFNGVSSTTRCQLKAFQEILRRNIGVRKTNIHLCLGMDDKTFVEAASSVRGKRRTAHSLEIVQAKTNKVAR